MLRSIAVIIRPPTSDDIEPLVEMGSRMHAESAYSFLPYDRDKVRRLIESYIGDRETQCGLVAEKDGVLTGMICGYLTDYFFCDERLACDMLLFVDQEYRSTSAAARLIQAFREWAGRHGARELSLGVTTEIRAEQVGRFYKWLGFREAGAIYKQRLEA
jgi:GNAT superfamily N-acetyltransferase